MIFVNGDKPGVGFKAPVEARDGFRDSHRLIPQSRSEHGGHDLRSLKTTDEQTAICLDRRLLFQIE
jgi:hypothetical protein